MTIENELNDGIIYNGNDIATTFSFPFKVNSKNQLSVRIRDNNDIEGSDLTVDSDFSVVDYDVEGDGIITYPISGDPLPTGYKIVITPKMDYKQESDLKNQGAYSQETYEDAFDTAMMHIKELRGMINRSVLFRKSSGITGQEYGEDPVDNRLLAWDGITGKIKNVASLPSDVLTTSFWETVLSDSNLSDSLDDLGFSAIGKALTTTASTSAAQTTLGGTTLGKTMFTLANALAGRNALELGVLNDVEFHDLTANDLNVNDITANDVGLQDLTISKALKVISTEATISSGVLTVASPVVRAKGEGDVADTITSFAVTQGEVFTLINNNAYAITLAYSPAIYLSKKLDVRLLQYDRITLFADETNQVAQISRDLIDDFNTGSGYYYLPNNKLVQYGEYTGGAHAPTITFPIAYDSLNNVMAIVSTATNNFIQAHTRTTANFVGRQTDDAGGNGGANFMWIAVGSKAQ